MAEPLLSLPEAARRLGVGRAQLYRAFRRGDLHAYVVGGWVRVRWTDVEAWVESLRVRREQRSGGIVQ